MTLVQVSLQEVVTRALVNEPFGEELINSANPNAVLAKHGLALSDQDEIQMLEAFVKNKPVAKDLWHAIKNYRAKIPTSPDLGGKPPWDILPWSSMGWYKFDDHGGVGQ